jgi:drug/metabolite transporter (DMT)-like permease
VALDERPLLRAMPWVFVLIWSTGFVVARLGMPHSPPLGFLSLRFALSVLCFVAWMRWSNVAWPDRAQWRPLAISGVLMHAGYLGGVWSAVKSGMGAGTVALLVGLQPVLTALWLSATAGERSHVSPRQWLGLLLGLAGLTLVVWRKLGVGEVSMATLALALGALLAITTGTLYQKRHVRVADVRAASTVQLIAAFVVSAPLALLLEHEPMQWHGELVVAMAWSVLALTLGGSSLLYLLIQRGAATQVTSLLYLVPPCTAAMAWLLFGEAFTPLMMLGMALTVGGVALVVRDGR